MSEAAPVRFYAADIFHARLRPVARRFRYRVLSLLIDIDRLPEADRCSRVFSVGRFNLLGFNSADHGASDGGPLRPHVEAQCRSAGVDSAISRILLLCSPRILGYVFNPLSVYFCLDAEGRAAALVYEVHNTFGERHFYVARAASDAGGAIPPHECDKGFYVSPFLDMSLRYRFRARVPDDALSLRIIERDQDGVMLTAIWQGKDIGLRAGRLLRVAFDTPLAGFKTIAAIHWQAMLIWLAGVGVRTRPRHNPQPGVVMPVHPRGIP